MRRCGTTRIGTAVVWGFLVCWAACSPDDPLPDDGEPPQTGRPDCGAVTYENFARQFFADYCLRCHSEQLVGDIARKDAPPGINYDTLEGVREFAERIRLRAGELGDMPPLLLGGPRPTEDERRRLMQWIDCDTPSETDPAPR